MSQIARVQVHEFTYEADNIGVDPGGFDLVQMPGSSRRLSKFGIVIETRDGSRGEYVGMWGATPMSLSQVLYLAPHLIGRDALQREFIYDEFKRALRQHDHMGYGYIDIALWDLFGKRVGLPIWANSRWLAEATADLRQHNPRRQARRPVHRRGLRGFRRTLLRARLSSVQDARLV